MAQSSSWALLPLAAAALGMFCMPAPSYWGKRRRGEQVLALKPRLGAPRRHAKAAQNVTALSEGHCLPTRVPGGQQHSKGWKGRRQGQAAQIGGHPAAQVKIRPGKGDGREKTTADLVWTPPAGQSTNPAVNEHSSWAHTLCQVSQCLRRGCKVRATVQLGRTLHSGHSDPAALGTEKPFPGITRWHCSSFKCGSAVPMKCHHRFGRKKILIHVFFYITTVISRCSHSSQRSWKSCANNKEITACGGGGGSLITFWTDSHTKIFHSRRITEVCLGTQNSPEIHTVLDSCIKKAGFLSEK